MYRVNIERIAQLFVCCRPVGRVGEDLSWWEEFVEYASFKSGMEERGSDGWICGVADDERGMKKEVYSRGW